MSVAVQQDSPSTVPVQVPHGAGNGRLCWALGGPGPHLRAGQGTPTRTDGVILMIAHTLSATLTSLSLPPPPPPPFPLPSPPPLPLPQPLPGEHSPEVWPPAQPSGLYPVPPAHLRAKHRNRATKPWSKYILPHHAANNKIVRLGAFLWNMLEHVGSTLCAERAHPPKCLSPLPKLR